VLAALCADTGRADPPASRAREQSPVARVCDLIARHADDHRLPRAFLARLLWKESRFDPNAVSYKGAEGIAQFMPGTAAMRGLEDAFDIEQAIPASAAYLAELSDRFGNLGLAAAAYNSGEARVTRWLANGGFLPLETENYVLDIMGEPADSFVERERSDEVPPLDEEKSFDDACREMPVSDFSTVAMATVPVLPWGIQVAGSFNRAAAIRGWQRVQARNLEALGDIEPVVSRVRSPIGRRGIYAVRIGAETRGEANELCAALRQAGGACVVTRNP
jgi:hypothetical protein